MAVRGEDGQEQIMKHAAGQESNRKSTALKPACCAPECSKKHAEELNNLMTK
jgi:hypothetical protein